MKENGFVISPDSQYPVVKVSKDSSCGGCSACHPSDDGNYVVKTININKLDIKYGDSVEIDVPQNKQKIVSVLLYSLPILAILLGLTLGNILALPIKKEPASILLTFILFTISLLFVRLLYKVNEKKFLPTLLRKIQPSESPFLTNLRENYKKQKGTQK